MKPFAIVLSVVALSLTACRGASHETAKTEPPAIAAVTARAQMMSVPQQFEAGGSVRSRVTAPIASRILAPVLEVHVRAGDRVRRGALLVRLDGREMTANQARAAATLTGSQESIRAAEGAVRAAEAGATLARATHQRVRGLFDKKSATAQELDQATSALEAAEAQLSSARANLASATAGREAAQAASEAASIASSYTLLTAPFDGVISERSVDPGAMAAPGQPLLTLEDPTAYRLEVTLDESRAALVSPGQTAAVYLDGAAGADWTDVKIVEIARLDPQSHGFVVKLDLPSGLATRSGTFGRARFATAPRQALVVPTSAAVHRGQLTFVFLVGENHQVRLQPVSPGAADAGRLEVLAGLRDGDQVVVNPPPALADGGRISEAGR